MVGLVSIDRLLLTPPQWAALALNFGVWFWRYRMGRVSVRPEPVEGHIALRQTQDERRLATTAVCALLPLWFAFWNTPSNVDVWLLFHDAAKVSRLSWSDMLAALPHQMYVDWQPPALTFYWSRLPFLWLHQLIMFPFALLCVELLFALYGRHAALLCATPVFALMIHQSCHDTILFGLLLVVLRLLQLGQRGWAAVVYGLTYAVKPLTFLTLPFLLPRLGWLGLVSVAMWGGYIGWSLSWEFGRRQTAYLLHLLLLGSKHAADAGDVGGVFTTLVEQPDRIGHNLAFRLGWRWTRIGRHALPALPFYLFPAYIRAVSWQGVGLILLILFGFGNSKYLLLALLFFFPVRHDDSSL